MTHVPMRCRACLAMGLAAVATTFALSGCLSSEPSGPEHLYVVDADGHNRRVLVENAGLPAWSPDGMLIAFVSRLSGPSVLEVIAPDGGARRPLLRARQFSTIAASWAPDSRRLAVRVNDIGARVPQSVLWLVDVASGKRRRIFGAAQSQVQEEPPAWSPDGRIIALTTPNPSTRRAPGPEVTAPAPTGRPPGVAPPPPSAPTPAPPAPPPVPPRPADPTEAPLDLMLVRAGEGSSRFVAPSPEDERAPRWLPDGRSLLVTASGRASSRLDEVTLDGRRRRLLEGDVLGAAAVSPDGRLVAVPAIDPRDRRVRPTIVTLTGRSTTIVDLEAQVLSWSPDGRWLAVGSPDGLYLVSADAQATRRIAELESPHQFTGIAWSPDGRRLAFSQFRQRIGD